jgi:nucleoside 2-deoxyribosyltransferase
MKIYFAHPAFTDPQKEFKARFLEELRVAVEKKHIEKGAPTPDIVDPFEFAPNVEDVHEHRTRYSAAIASICCRLMEDCFIVIAAVDHDDAGVAFELGFAYALDIPALLVSETRAADEVNAMLGGTSRAAVTNVLHGDRMAALVDLVYGFWATKP